MTLSLRNQRERNASYMLSEMITFLLTSTWMPEKHVGRYRGEALIFLSGGHGGEDEGFLGQKLGLAVRILYVVPTLAG